MSGCEHRLSQNGRCRDCGSVLTAVIAAQRAALAELEAQVAALKEAAKAVVDDCYVTMNRMPPETDNYGINGRKLYALKTALIQESE